GSGAVLTLTGQPQRGSETPRLVWPREHVCPATRPGLRWEIRNEAGLAKRVANLPARCLLCGLRTEEARALRWAHVDLNGNPAASPPVPPHVAVWRSVRVHGETKTERSRRTLGLPAAAVQALRAWSASQAEEQLAAGQSWQDTGLVFTSHLGAALDAGNVRKMFKRVCTEAGAGDGWTPRELRTTFVSLMSHQGSASTRSPGWWGTPPPEPPRSSTAANCGASS